MGKNQIKRGLEANLPTEALDGELLYTKDTKKFYIGNGTGKALTVFENAEQLKTYLSGKSDTGHKHTAIEITDFDTSVDARINAQKGQANGIASLDGTGKIPNAQIPTTFKEAAVVNDIAARDQLTPFQGMHALVIDASGDETVESGGGAEYVYNGSKWIKISEFNELDTLVDWENVQNKPSFVKKLVELEDVPHSLEGQAGMILVVNPEENAFVFTSQFSGDIDGGEF